MEKKLKSQVTFVLLILVALFSGCANSENIQGCFKDQPSGFFGGILHGFFLFPAFIVSLFDSNYAIYDVNNTGHLYDLGFLIGLGFFSDRASSSARKVAQKPVDKEQLPQDKGEAKEKPSIDGSEKPVTNSDG